MIVLNVLCALAGGIGFFLVSSLIQAVDNDDVQFLLGALVLIVPTLVTALYVFNGGILNIHFICYGVGWVISIVTLIGYVTIFEE